MHSKGILRILQSIKYIYWQDGEYFSGILKRTLKRDKNLFRFIERIEANLTITSIGDPYFRTAILKEKAISYQQNNEY